MVTRTATRRASVDAAPSAGRSGVPALFVAACPFLSVVLVAGASGGYYPDAWGWLVLAFGWVAAMGLVLRERVALGRLEVAALAAMALLTGWIGLSVLWSDDVPQSVFELQRALVYLVALLATLVGLRRRSLGAFLGGLLAGIAATCTAGLLTRFFPSQGAGDDVILVNRLADPIGYWNAMGIVAAMGALLALGFAAHGRGVARVASAALLPLLMTTVYFTYSRGAWIALAIGILAAVCVDPRRLRLVTIALLLAPPAAAAVAVSASSNALTRLEAAHDVIVQDGRRVALVLLALVAVSAAVALLIAFVEARVRPAAGVRRGWGIALIGVATIGLAVVLVRMGGPVAMADDAWRSFKDQNPAPTGEINDLNRRLFTLRGLGRVEFWEASLRQNQERPLLGAGAGAFEQHWLKERTFASQIRDAHSLYMETLGEVGWIGLALLAMTLVLPVAAGLRARGNRLVPGALGAFVAFLAHAAVDWDWEIPAVTLVALASAATLLIADRASAGGPSFVSPGARVSVVTGLVAIVAFSTVALVGNRALGRAGAAADEARWPEAQREARTAQRWAPWAAAAWQHMGTAQLGFGRPRQARASLLEATRKDPSDWRIWYDLGTASGGRKRLHAYRRAARLNPFAEDVRTLRERGYRLPVAPEPTR